MTDWVPGDWGNVTAGDRVRLEAADAPALAGTIQAINHKQGHRIGVATEMGWKKTETWQNLGWSLFVPVPTQPELPTEVESVIAVRSLGTRWRPVHRTGSDGWQISGHSGYMNQKEILDWINGRPWVRLLPEADMAKKVLDRVSRINGVHGDSGINFRAALKEVAAEFGVSLD